MSTTIPVGLVRGLREVRIEEFPAPVPAPGKAVVDISYCGICGTDVHAFVSGEPYNPAICGHEWVGHVSAADASVTNVREGDRVAIGVASACGQCSMCQRGDAQAVLPPDFPVVRRNFPAENAQQGRLAGAVAAHQAHALAPFEFERHVIQQGVMAIGQ